MKKALIMKGGRFHPFDSCAKILEDFLKRDGICESVVTEDRNAFKNLKDYDLVIDYTQGGELTLEQEKGLCKFVRNGGGFIGIHSASDSWVKNDEYMEMLGSHFIGHGPVTEFTVNISPLEHDITRRIFDFKVVDEFYILEKKTSHFEVLATGNWQFKTHPLSYTREYGKGRVFYTALGHDERAFNNPFFQKLIFRAVRWVTGEKEGESVRCGIIGYGGTFNMGKHHADLISNVKGLKVTAICDVNKERLKSAEKDFPGVKTYESIENMLSDDIIDLGVVVVPHNVHGKVALSLLEKKKHTIVEKPFVISAEEGKKLIEVSKKNGVMLSVFHNRRWDGDFVTIKNIIAQGMIGDIFHIETFAGGYSHPRYWWRSEKSISGGIVYDWGAHFIDWILNLMPGKIEKVYGLCHKRVWFDVTNEDQCHIIILFEGGRYADFQTSSISAIGKPKWRILGTKGGLTLNHGEDKINVVTFINGHREELKIPFPEGDWSGYYINIADHLLTKEPLKVTPESALQVINVLEMAEKNSLV